MIGALISVGTILILRAVNSSFNEQDPLYFGSSYRSRFRYYNGTDYLFIDFDTYSIHSNYTTCRISINGNIYLFNYTLDGFFIDKSLGLTNNQSIFWLHIVQGLGSENWGLVGTSYSVFDPIGILGTANSSYVATITGNDVYWALEAPLHGAQASFEIVIKDMSGGVVAFGEIDMTCGIVFQLHIGASTYRSIQLIDTNYVISRNRMSALIPIILSTIISPIAVFVYIYFKKKNYSKEDLIDTTFLVLYGNLVLDIDFVIDIWMYAPFGFLGNMLIHFGMVSLGIIFSLVRHYKLKWTIPSILEVLFVGSMTIFVGESYVPHLTAFMGLTLSWLILIWLTGYKRQKNRSLKGKIISNLV